MLLRRDDVLVMLYYLRKKLATNREEALEILDKIIDAIEAEAEADFLVRFGLKS